MLSSCRSHSAHHSSTHLLVTYPINTYSHTLTHPHTNAHTLLRILSYTLTPAVPISLSSHPIPHSLRPLEELISHRVVPTLSTQFHTLWEVAQLRAVWQVVGFIYFYALTLTPLTLTLPTLTLTPLALTLTVILFCSGGGVHIFLWGISDPEQRYDHLSHRRARLHRFRVRHAVRGRPRGVVAWIGSLPCFLF